MVIAVSMYWVEMDGLTLDGDRVRSLFWSSGPPHIIVILSAKGRTQAYLNWGIILLTLGCCSAACTCTRITSAGISAFSRIQVLAVLVEITILDISSKRSAVIIIYQCVLGLR